MRISSKFSSSFSLISTFSLLLLSPPSTFFPRARTCLLSIEPKSSSTGLGLGFGLGGSTLGLGGFITRGGIGGGNGILGPPFTGAIVGITGGFGIDGTTGILLLVFGIGGGIGMLLDGISGAFGTVFVIGGGIGILLEGFDGG